MGKANIKSLTTALDREVDLRSLKSKLGYRVRMLDRAMSREFTQRAGMTQVQFSVFSLIATNDGLSQVAIGEALGMDRASTMAIINKLEDAGLILRKKSTLDRRVHALELTKKGEKEFPVVNEKVMDYDNSFSCRLTESELKTLNKYIKKLVG